MKEVREMNNELQNIKEMFIKAKSRKLSKNTLDNYYSDIKNFLDMIMIENNCSEDEAIKLITPLKVENFINDNESSTGEKSYSKATLNRKIASLTSFYDWLIKMKILEIKENPFKHIDRYSEVESKAKDILYIDEIKKVIESTYKKERIDKNFEFASARTRFIISMMTTTGLRIEEVLNIKFKDIEPVGDDFMVNIPKENSKNKEERRVPICASTKKYYLEYLNERNKLDLDCDLLILSNNKKKLSTKDSRVAIDKYVKRAGIEDKKICNHSFRHTFRSVATSNNVNEALICVIGGWSRKALSNQSNVYLHDDEKLDNIKISICSNIL